MSDPNPQTPVVTVISGSPTPEELAALIVVLTATAGMPAESATAGRSHRPRVGGWKSYARTLRKPVHPGPGAWRLVDR